MPHPRITSPSPRLVDVQLVADHMGSELAFQRHALDDSLEEVFTRLADTFNLGGLSPAEHLSMAQAVAQVIADDRVYYSEVAMATRAVLEVLGKNFPGQVEISGAWLPGEYLLDASGRRFELTGGTCPDCNGPAAHGRGGGLLCINTAGCGWWFCY